MNKLVILESPGKIKKVSHYLKDNDKNNNYIVKASIGHFRNIANTGIDNLGIDLNTMKPIFKIDPTKKKVVDELIKCAKDVDQIILATDPDREGEAIAWHLYDVLKPYNSNFKRMRLNSITSDCIKRELNNLSEIDQNYVKSAITRQLIDRILGYLLSDDVRKKCGSLSAGRVQSTSLRILADRQEEINNYVVKNWYCITDNINGILFKNYNFENDKMLLNKFETYEEAQTAIKNMNNFYKVKDIKKVIFYDKKILPFSTVDMLKASGNLLKFKTTETQNTAQSLYEKGWITYIRTDSNNMDETSTSALKSYVSNHFNQNEIGVIETVKAKDTDQEGHPAIVPTDFNKDIKYIEDNKNKEEILELNEKEIKLYSLIWCNTVSSILKQPSGEKITYILENFKDKQKLYFASEFKNYNFKGYYDVHKYLKLDDNNDFEKLNYLKSGDVVNIGKLEIIKENDSPPSYYNEVSLIETLQKKEIGRPSTYKYAVEINKARGYVDIVDSRKGSMKVNSNGMQLNDYLKNNFSNVINVLYTKGMENDLDLIAKGEINDVSQYLKKYYNLIKKLCANSKMKNDVVKCSLCNNVMILRTSKTNKFYGCSNYPNCKNIINIVDEDKKQKCSNCETGFMIKKKAKDGTWFYGCSNYPKCKKTNSITVKNRKVVSKKKRLVK